MKEKPRAGGSWTEARFWGFIRSNLRRASIKWPPISQALEAARRESQSDNRRLKWEYQCAACDGWFPRKEVQVDHHPEVGSLKCLEDLPGFVERLFCEADKLYILCVVCHANKETLLNTSTHGPNKRTARPDRGEARPPARAEER